MMKRFHVAALVFAVLALAATASAQSSTSQFVIGGETAKKIHDFGTINLATAERIAEKCEDLARKESVAVSIYILDNEGNHVYMHRMEGQGYLNIVTAEMKARTALLTRAPSKARMNQVLRNPDTELQQIQIGLFANSGGLPIMVNDQLIGAVGVGGSAPRFELPQGVAPKSTLPPEFVVTGKAAANIFDGNQISSEAAKKIARTCRDWAAAKGGTASIYILDTHGTFVHQERGDGQIYTNIHTAMLKAGTALQTRRPTSIPNAQLRNDPSGTPRQLVQFGFFTNSGGIPIVVDGEMIGAIGVGGGAGGGGDENCAIEGLKAAFGNRVLLPVYPPKSNN